MEFGREFGRFVPKINKKSLVPGFMSGVLVFSGCTDSRANNTATPPSYDRATAETNIGLPADFLQSYPELLQTGLRVKSGGSIDVESNIPTQVYNMTDFTYHPETAQEIYAQMESLINPQKFFHLYYNLSGVRMLFSAYSYSNINSRTTVIVPKGTPRPKLWLAGQTLDFSQLEAFTSRHPDLSLRTFVEVTDRVNPYLPPIFNSPQAKATLAFTVEACQQIAYVKVIDEQGKEQMDELLHLTGQEVFCNVLGYGIASRIMSVPYQNYQTSTKNLLTVDRRTNITSNRLVPIPESIYMGVKPSGPLIK